jgi:hypothetical protein
VSVTSLGLRSSLALSPDGAGLAGRARRHQTRGNEAIAGGQGIHYTLSDRFDTFAFPESIASLEAIGEEYHELRRGICLDLNLGLTQGLQSLQRCKGTRSLGVFDEGPAPAVSSRNADPPPETTPVDI